MFGLMPRSQPGSWPSDWEPGGVALGAAWGVGGAAAVSGTGAGILVLQPECGSASRLVQGSTPARPRGIDIRSDRELPPPAGRPSGGSCWQSMSIAFIPVPGDDGLRDDPRSPGHHPGTRSIGSGGRAGGRDIHPGRHEPDENRHSGSGSGWGSHGVSRLSPGMTSAPAGGIETTRFAWWCGRQPGGRRGSLKIRHHVPAAPPSGQGGGNGREPRPG
jgi:hypothetical protein